MINYWSVVAMISKSHSCAVVFFAGVCIWFLKIFFFFVLWFFCDSNEIVLNLFKQPHHLCDWTFYDRLVFPLRPLSCSLYSHPITSMRVDYWFCIFVKRTIVLKFLINKRTNKPDKIEEFNTNKNLWITNYCLTYYYADKQIFGLYY